MAYDPYKMKALNKEELKKHAGHELTVKVEGIESKTIAVLIECVTCRIPDTVLKGAYYPCVLVKKPW